MKIKNGSCRWDFKGICQNGLEYQKALQAYIEGAKDLRVWAAYQESDVVGFISLSYSSEDCAEIDCLGVKSHSKIKELEGINYDYRKRSSQTSGLPTGQNSGRRF